MRGSRGGMVSSLDFESSDPNSNLGGTRWEYMCDSNSPLNFGALKAGLFIISSNTH